MVSRTRLIPDGIGARVRELGHCAPSFAVCFGSGGSLIEAPGNLSSVRRLCGESRNERGMRRSIVIAFVPFHAADHDLSIDNGIRLREGSVFGELVIVAPVAERRREGIAARVDEVRRTAACERDALAKLQRTVAVDALRRSKGFPERFIQIAARVGELLFGILRPGNFRDRMLFNDERFSRLELQDGAVLLEGVVTVRDLKRDRIAARGRRSAAPDIACVDARVGNASSENALLLAVDKPRNAPAVPCGNGCIDIAVRTAVRREGGRKKGGIDRERVFKGKALIARFARPAGNSEVGIGERHGDRIAARVQVFCDRKSDGFIKIDVERAARNGVGAAQTAREHLGGIIARAAVGCAFFIDLDRDLRRSDRISLREGSAEYVVVCLLGSQFRRKQIFAGVSERRRNAVLRDLLRKRECAVVINAPRRCERFVIFRIQIGIAVGQVIASPPTGTADFIAIDRETLLLRFYAICKLIVLAANRRRDGVAARFELIRIFASAVERTRI